MTTWLASAKVVDLHPAIGNGPFADCYGVILHVNVSESGTPDSFWGNGNAGQVCPNFQVYKDGSIHQMLPLNWQPWCQKDGNFHYAAIETAGMPSEPLTDAQVAACARIVRAYHAELGVPLRLANAPGERGLGTHQMGGAAWGGHPCPGDIRAAQRAAILKQAAVTVTPPDPIPATVQEDDMILFTTPPVKGSAPNPILVAGPVCIVVGHQSTTDALKAAGAKVVSLPADDYARIRAQATA